MKKVEGQIKSIDNALKGSGASAGFQRQLASLGKSAAEIDSVSAAWRKYASSVGAAENAGSWTKGQANQIRSWEQATIKSLRNVESQEKAFQRSQQQLANAHIRSADRVGERVGVGHMVRNGVLAYAGAHGVFHAGKSVIEQGAETAHELAQIQAAHQPTPEEMETIKKHARETSRDVPSSTFADNLKTINETIGAYGSVEHALEHLTANQKIAVVVHASAGDKIQQSSSEMGQAFAIFSERRQSAQDPHRSDRENKELARAMIFSGGRFNPQEMLGFSQQAHSALPLYDEQFLTKIVPSLVTERGGQKAGTEASAFQNVIMGKARDAKQAQMWMDLGLLDPKQVTRNNSGAVIGWTAGAVKNTDLALKNPLAWAEQVQNPAMRAHGINPDDNMEMSKTLGTMFRNQMANQFANDISQLNSRNRLHKDQDLLGKTMTIDQAFDYNMKSDPTQSLKTITASLTDFGSALSSPALQQVGPVLTGIAGGVKSLAQLAQDHPHLATTGAIVGGSAALGGAGWFASQMAGGFGLSKSATELDASAAALMRAAGAIGAGGVGEAAAGASAGAGAKPSRLRRFGRLAGRTLKALPVVGAVTEAADAARDFELAHGAGQQPGADGSEGYDSILGSPRPRPFVPEAPRQYDAFKDALEEYRRASQPGWTVAKPSTSWPMVGSGGATAGVEGPEFPGVTGLNGAAGVPEALNQGAQTQAAGEATGAGYLEGLRSQLDAAASYAEEIAQRIRNALDFSVTPTINSPSGAAESPRRTSSLNAYDHGRASAAGSAGWPLG